MSITVEEALSLHALKTAKVATGKDGLSRVIHRVSVSECPEFESDDNHTWKKNILFDSEPGDFFITTFHSIKDSEEQILATIKLYNEYNSSGLLISDVYFNELPQKALQYANEHDYPIIFISCQVPYAEIISEIMECIYLTKQQNQYIQIIDDIRNSSSPKEVKKLSYIINKFFNEVHRAIYITGDILSDLQNQFIERINKNKENKAFRYKDGILALYTSNQSQDLSLDSIINTINPDKFPNIYLGISKIHEHIYEVNKSIEEAIMTSSFINIMNQNILQYKDLGIYRLLYLLKDNDGLWEFSSEIINKLTDYDSKNGTELLKTAEVYIENNGDLKKTAKSLFQHENTIRYRITKIKSITEMDSKDIEFYEQLSVAIKVKKMEDMTIR